MTDKTEGSPRKRRNPAPEPLLLTINDAAGVIGIGRTKMLEYIERGVVDTVQLGGMRRVTMESLKRVADDGVAA